jgi:hypothetical protein
MSGYSSDLVVQHGTMRPGKWRRERERHWSKTPKQVPVFNTMRSLKKTEVEETVGFAGTEEWERQLEVQDARGSCSGGTV